MERKEEQPRLSPVYAILKIDARKRTRADALLKTKEGKKSLKRAKTKGKMADFGDMISNFIEFGGEENEPL